VILFSTARMRAAIHHSVPAQDLFRRWEQLQGF
jgi:hypothetical protein